MAITNQDRDPAINEIMPMWGSGSVAGSEEIAGLTSTPANQVLAGPASGADAPAGVRSLVDGDIPATIVRDTDPRLSDTRTPADNTVSTAKLQNDAVTYPKIQNVSATDKILGRATAGAGDIEEITCTAAARSILDDASIAAILVTLGVGASTSGTWTPVDNSGAGLVFAAASGWWRRIGDLMIVGGAITYPATASGANAQFGGLPVATAAGNDNRLGFVSTKTDATVWAVQPGAGSTAAFFIDNVGAAITNATLSGDTFFFLIVYHV